MSQNVTLFLIVVAAVIVGLSGYSLISQIIPGNINQ